MSISQQARLLIVDDESAQMEALCNTLRDHGYRTNGFTSGSAALAAMRVDGFDLLLADLTMPAMDGITLLQEALKIDGDLVGVIMTGEGTITSAVDAMKTGALDYILKPFKLSVVLPVLARALAVRSLRVTNAELERNVRQRTLELETANKELEAFSYSISHDLRSPLMVVMAGAEQLIEEHWDQLPPAARSRVNAIMNSAERMRQLIGDLLRLSRLGCQPLNKRPIDVSALMEEVVEEVRQHYSGRRVDVRLGDMLDCVGDPGLLKQAFTNLISNAFKFTCGKETSIVEVGCRQELGQKIYSVRDNGVGFDMQYAQKLFGAFHRLHSAEQFEGTGVGLSIVHRVIERHGGHIWADAQLGEGATFHFSLPD